MRDAKGSSATRAVAAGLVAARRVVAGRVASVTVSSRRGVALRPIPTRLAEDRRVVLTNAGVGVAHTKEGGGGAVVAGPVSAVHTCGAPKTGADYIFGTGTAGRFGAATDCLTLEEEHAPYFAD